MKKMFVTLLGVMLASVYVFGGADSVSVTLTTAVPENSIVRIFDDNGLKQLPIGRLPTFKELQAIPAAEITKTITGGIGEKELPLAYLLLGTSHTGRVKAVLKNATPFLSEAGGYIPYTINGTRVEDVPISTFQYNNGVVTSVEPSNTARVSPFGYLSVVIDQDDYDAAAAGNYNATITVELVEE